MGLADDLIRHVREGEQDGLRDVAGKIKELAIRNMPIGDPTDDPSPEIALREHVDIVPDRYGGLVVVVNTAYAAKQEFDLHLHHPRGGGGHFLHRAIAEVAPTMAGVIAGRIQARTTGP